jgi:hypothetical protein
MQRKYEVDELGKANDIDNELKIRRWVMYQLALDEKFVVRINGVYYRLVLICTVDKLH